MHNQNKLINLTMTICYKKIRNVNHFDLHQRIVVRLKKWQCYQNIDVPFFYVIEHSIENGFHAHFAMHVPDEVDQSKLKRFIKKSLGNEIGAEPTRSQLRFGNHNQLSGRTPLDSHYDIARYYCKTFNPNECLLDVTTGNISKINVALGIDDRGKRANNMTPIWCRRFACVQSLSMTARQKLGFKSSLDHWKPTTRRIGHDLNMSLFPVDQHAEPKPDQSEALDQ